MAKIEHDIQDAHLLSYIIASSDMRYIPINERDVYLRHDPQLGLVIQGEVPGCGPDCNSNLSYMLLEYSMSCEDCKDRVMTAESVDRFGEHLGRVFVDKFYPERPPVSKADLLAGAFEVVLNSMGIQFKKEVTGERLRFDLTTSPFHQAAGKTGLVLQVTMAHRAFVALCQSILQALAPDWSLVQPSEPEPAGQLREVLFVKA